MAATLLALTFALILAFGPAAAHAQAGRGAQAPPVTITPLNVERNVIYGMYSGFALLMDVHRPVRANGYGIVFVAGSGWQAPLDYGATPLKETQIPLWGPALVAAGYTVFAVNHRAAPRFHYRRGDACGAHPAHANIHRLIQWLHWRSTPGGHPAASPAISGL